jgi:predicted nuclease with TOPRIM domain
LKGKTAALEVAKELCVKLEMYSSSSLQQVSTESDSLRAKLETLQLEQTELENELRATESALEKTNDRCEMLESESSVTRETARKRLAE